VGYVVKLDQGDYLQLRGGFDWGRSEKHRCTLFDTFEEAEKWAKHVGSMASVEEE
jgi:hypothetical protein